MLSNKKSYFENLDGLRFIAFLSVFIAHCFLFSQYKIASPVGNKIVGHFFLNGDLGVNFFFVLSGFLITYLLISEKEKSGTLAIKKFYMRRILRIWPVYFLVIGLGFFFIPFIFQYIPLRDLLFSVEVPLSKLPWYLAFIVNFDVVLNGINYLTIVGLWSVSVEEQFYLIWPILNRFTSKYSLLGALCLLMILSYYYRLTYYFDATKIRYSSFSVVNDLAVGGIIAWLVIYSEKFLKFFRELKKYLILSIYSLFFICIPLRGFSHYFSEGVDQILLSFEPFLFSLFFAFIILEQNFSLNSFYKLSNFKQLNKLGKISYGLYCYHMICILIIAFLFKITFGEHIQNSLLLFILQFLLTLALTVLISKLSFRFLESRLLKLKEKFIA